MVAERHWQIRVGEKWVDIADVNEQIILCVGGKGIQWRGVNSWLPVPMLKGRLRYRVPVHGQWMVWRGGNFSLLAMDFGRRDVAEAVRREQAEARQARMVEA